MDTRDIERNCPHAIVTGLPWTHKIVGAICDHINAQRGLGLMMRNMKTGEDMPNTRVAANRLRRAVRACASKP